MKRSAKRILSLLLAACMMLGLLPALALTSWAEETGAVDYADAEDGDLLYTVDFGYDDVYTKHYSDTTATATVSEDGRRLTFSGKAEAAATYYGGFLRKYPVVGHVYTISYYTETSSLNIRHGVQVLIDEKRIGMVSVAGKTDAANMLINGSTGASVPYTVSRKNDIENNNRQYFKVVVDGIRMVAQFYALDTENNYSLVAETAIDCLNTSFRNYLCIGMYNWDALAGESFVAVGDVQIAKGNTVVSGKTAYQQAYDAAAYGDVLYEVDFREDNEAGFEWGDHRASSNKGTVSEDGSTLTYLYTNEDETVSGAAQAYAAYFPDPTALNYGTYTYEFFLNSGTEDTKVRAALNVIGYGSGNSAGFSYFNGANQFSRGGNFVGITDSTLINVNSMRLTLTSYSTTLQPDTSDSSKPNVKIEVDTLTKTITNFVLNGETGEFEAVASICYAGGTYASLIFPYAWNKNNTVIIKDMKIVKGLSVTGEDSAILDLVVDGTSNVQLLTDETRLPAITQRPNYTAAYELPDGTVVTSISDLELTTGFNRVELTTVYTPVAIAAGQVELRGIQSLKEPTGGVTSVRLIGIVNTLELEAVGFEIIATYRDAEGTVHYGNDIVALSTDTVWSSVLANGNVSVTAEELGGKYVYAITINNVPVGEGVQVDFFVMPYSIAEGLEDVEENREYATDMNISIVNGQYDANAMPLE